MKRENIPFHIASIMHQAELTGISAPLHPLMSIFRLEQVPVREIGETIRFTTGFYAIALKHGCTCKLKYGQTFYDFNQGVLSFFAPNQVHTLEAGDAIAPAGWSFNIHPDFIRNTSLDAKMKQYHFFQYAINEALILSEQEEAMINNILQSIAQEYQQPIDRFSQDIIINQLELLLNYSNRFYNRQFITRKPAYNNLLEKVEQILHAYFENDQTAAEGLPTVRYLAAQLHMSSKYLSDTLRQLTGQSAQQHIHDCLIKKAKEVLAGTRLSVGEIAYQLGFAYPQAFNKLFRNKTAMSPMEYRQLFN